MGAGRRYSRRKLGFIDWAKKQIELYAALFRKQVYSSDVEQPIIDEALKITHSQSRKVCLYTPSILSLTTIQLLQEFGLDFRYLLDDLLAQHPKAPSISAPQSMPTRLAIPAPSHSRAPNSPSSPSPSPSRANRPSTPTSRLQRPSLPRVDSSSIPSTPVRPLLPRSHNSARAAGPPPPRSMNRPGGSAVMHSAHVAIPDREGMI